MFFKDAKEPVDICDFLPISLQFPNVANVFHHFLSWHTHSAVAQKKSITLACENMINDLSR